MWENASIFAFKIYSIVFLPARLRSSTYNITGLVVEAGQPIPSAKNA